MGAEVGPNFCAGTSPTRVVVLVQTHIITRVSGIRHDFQPALKGCHLKERQIGPANVVKLHVGVFPDGVILIL